MVGFFAILLLTMELGLAMATEALETEAILFEPDDFLSTLNAGLLTPLPDESTLPRFFFPATFPSLEVFEREADGTASETTGFDFTN